MTPKKKKKTYLAFSLFNIQYEIDIEAYHVAGQCSMMTRDPVETETRAIYGNFVNINEKKKKRHQ